MDWVDTGKAVGLSIISSIVGAIFGGMKVSYTLKPKIDKAVEDITVLKEHEFVRVQSDIKTLADEVVKKEACIQCNKDICHRLDTLKGLSDRNYNETLEVRKDIRLLIDKRTQLF